MAASNYRVSMFLFQEREQLPAVLSTFHSTSRTDSYIHSGTSQYKEKKLPLDQSEQPWTEVSFQEKRAQMLGRSAMMSLQSCELHRCWGSPHSI
jgi:hypothetical protein